MDRPMLQWLSFNRLGTLLTTRRIGELVGSDEFGNNYYREAGAEHWRREKRWVVYPADVDPEPSSVPPGWAGWLHRRVQFPPSERPLPAPRWEREHLPNMTGTAEAYLPSGHVRQGGQRDHATGDYEAWTPE
ncbi:MAG: NADH:ubiquinone oxidoreductase subunit NDUFA12 [Geminicoccaceae bacterium]